MNQRELFLRHVAQTSDQPLSGIDLNIEKAAGVYLYDQSGKIYLDLISGISVSSIGHCHPQVVKAIREQSEKYMHLMVYGEFNQQPQVTYALELCKYLPASLSSVYFTSGGSESMEGAMKLVKRATGRQEIIYFDKAYHGSTQGALSLMGDEYFKSAFRPLLPGTRQLRYNNFEDLTEITSATAGVFLEPIQGEAGVRPADKRWIQALAKRCEETGTQLVFDEIQTGFGRTGSLFYFEQLDVVPDVLLIAKGMGGGLPIGAFVASTELMNLFRHDPVLGHINTFGGNAVCVAAAQATLEVIQENQLFKRAFEIEKQIRQSLFHPLIKEMRLCGALGAIDFKSEAINMKVIRACLEAGLVSDWFLFCTTAMRISPPLTITEKELEAGIKTLLTCLDKVQSEL
jgi:acetylornithine/N-succinyldiaminopimelate aminotransferase